MNDSTKPLFESERGASPRAPFIWIGVLFLILAGAYVLTLGGTPGTLTFVLGRFHPVLVHLPIGFLIGLLVLEGVVLVKPEASVGTARAILLGGGCLFAVLSGAVGLCLAREGGYEPELLFWHQWLGVATAVLSLAAAALYVGARLRTYRLVLLAAVVALIWAGHDGASLTHGEDYLTEHLWEGTSEEEIEEYQMDMTRDVMPILRLKCIPCHGPDKQDGKLRLDVPEEILEGGESQRPAALPGDLSASYIAELVTLPRNHKLAMPPKNAAPLTRQDNKLEEKKRSLQFDQLAKWHEPIFISSLWWCSLLNNSGSSPRPLARGNPSAFRIFDRAIGECQSDRL